MCRKCIICGKDISHLKSNAKLCGDKKCEYAYAKIRKATKDDDRFCEICGDKINDLPRQRKICLKEECIRQQKIRKYHSALKTKICERCGNEFEGTYKQKLCPQCRENRKPLERKEIEVTLYCKYCKKPIGKEVRLMTILSSTEDYTFVCDECKQAHREETAERMRQHNPMFDKNVSKKVAKTKRQKYVEKCLSENKIPSKPHVRKGETKEETAERMRQHNPMFDKNVSKKVAKTLKQRYKDGTIPKHFGKDNWNWKGNRNFNKAVRINLRKWVKEMFIKNNFTCQICGKNKGELHVHHIEPLRDIISNFMEKENYTIEYINDIEGTDEYQEFINKIVKYHYDNDNIGIVLCPECHAKMDRQYRLRKKIILIMKIKSIKRVPFEGNVYNIGVANNNNYFANKCLVHNCYVSAKKDGEAYKNPSETWKKWMATYKETLTKDGILLTERPLQIAIGSEGEPCATPYLCDFLKTVYETNVVPNYTTNGIVLSHWNKPESKYYAKANEILDATKKYVGGVAVSYGNKSLRKYADNAIDGLLAKGDCHVMIHHIISDNKSVDEFVECWKKYGDKIRNHVLLPLMASGRSKKGIEDGTFEYLEDTIEAIGIKNVAFGAHFIKSLEKSHKIKTWIYPAETYSKNVLLKENEVVITSSSFNLIPVKVIKL